jgi:hypothetical protein
MKATQTAETEPADSPETTELHVAYPTAPPDFTAFDVKALTPETLLGAPCTVAVVGQSHVVTAPELGYHEVCSCVAQSVTPSETVALDPGVTAQVDASGSGENETVRATTDVSVRPLTSFPGPEETTIAYRFDPAAWTTVTVGERGYETYHTYPERDVVVRTETRLSTGARPRVDTAEAGGHTAETTPRRADR